MTSTGSSGRGGEMSTAEMLEGIRRWVEIESQTADVEGVNRAMSEAAENWRAAGARVERIPGRDGRGDHILVSSPWGASEKGILVLCHLDTVHPRGTLEGHLPFRVEGDKAFGPGTYDMKGGAFLPLAAFRSIMASGRHTPLPIRVLYASDEEVGSPTSRHLIEAEAERAKYVLVTEPAREGGKVVTGRKGVGRYEMRARGRPSHAGSKHKEGRSAIREIARLVVEIEAMTDYARGVTFNVGQIHGGTADNVVPEHCWAAVDMRVKTMGDAEAMDKRLKALKAQNPDVVLTVTGGLNRPPYEKNEGVTRLYDHARSIAGELGFPLGEIYTGGGSDGNFTAHRVPTLDGLGVDGAGAHTLGEHLLVSSLVPRMRLQRRLFETLN